MPGYLPVCGRCQGEGLRRSVEVRALTTDQLQADGILWTAAKRQKGQATRTGYIEWSPELPVSAFCSTNPV